MLGGEHPLFECRRAIIRQDFHFLLSKHQPRIQFLGYDMN